MLHSAESDLGLHCLQKPICPNRVIAVWRTDRLSGEVALSVPFCPEGANSFLIE